MDALAVGKPKDLLYGHYTLPVFFESVIIFLIFLKLPDRISNIKIAKIVEQISKYTLFVYLAHIYVMEHLRLWFEVSTISFNAWISVPILSIFAYVICMICAWSVD